LYIRNPSVESPAGKRKKPNVGIEGDRPAGNGIDDDGSGTELAGTRDSSNKWIS
jgi:hypothetical protein